MLQENRAGSRTGRFFPKTIGGYGRNIDCWLTASDKKSPIHLLDVCSLHYDYICQILVISSCWNITGCVQHWCFTYNVNLQNRRSIFHVNPNTQQPISQSYFHLSQSEKFANQKIPSRRRVIFFGTLLVVDSSDISNGRLPGVPPVPHKRCLPRLHQEGKNLDWSWRCAVTCHVFWSVKIYGARICFPNDPGKHRKVPSFLANCGWF